MTPAQRHRAKIRAMGLTRCEAYAHPDDHAAIKAYAATLAVNRADPTNWDGDAYLAKTEVITWLSMNTTGPQ